MWGVLGDNAAELEDLNVRTKPAGCSVHPKMTCSPPYPVSWDAIFWRPFHPHSDACEQLSGSG